MIRRPPRSTLSSSSAASDVYKRQTFYFSNPASSLLPTNMSHVLFQASLAILVLVGFESITALTSEAKNPKDVPRAIILSLVIQAACASLPGFFPIPAWITDQYTLG